MAAALASMENDRKRRFELQYGRFDSDMLVDLFQRSVNKDSRAESGEGIVQPQLRFESGLEYLPCTLIG